MKSARRYFPLGKAYGKAFCNRTEEIQQLMGHIKNGKHTIIEGPRRYGKSSLCEKVLEKIDMPWFKLDFHLAVTERDAERILVNGVMELIGKSFGSIEKLIHVIKKNAKKLKPKLGVGDVFKLELESSAESSPSENIAEALFILEKLLGEKNQYAVLLLDEFQEIGQLENGKGIEGAIRHVAQEMQHLVLIFSGSNPHLLRAMFEDERRPLYKLCRKLMLSRISEIHYKTHLNEAAHFEWEKNLNDDVFQCIMSMTERHPYYVNYLCDIVWSDNKTIPSVNDVKKAWDRVVDEERSDLLKDFFSLSENQRKVMIHIANEGGENIYRAEVAKKMDMPASSISRVLVTLLEKDYIEKEKDCYHLIVPVYKALLKKE